MNDLTRHGIYKIVKYNTIRWTALSPRLQNGQKLISVNDIWQWPRPLLCSHVRERDGTPTSKRNATFLAMIGSTKNVAFLPLASIPPRTRTHEQNNGRGHCQITLTDIGSNSFIQCWQCAWNTWLHKGCLWTTFFLQKCLWGESFHKRVWEKD